MENGVATGARLKFEEWHVKEEGFLLPKVWLWVTGIRKPLREYLNPLPEFTSLPSAGGFAERFFSGAQQRRLCREPNKKYSAKPLHSAKKVLPSVR
jgi:hypothetical protein